VVVTEDNQRVDIVPPQDASIQITRFLVCLATLNQKVRLFSNDNICVSELEIERGWWK
jgi:hypothetical protein